MIKTLINQQQFPTGFVLDIIRYGKRYEVCLYRSNFRQFSQETQFEIILKMQALHEAISAAGIPCDIAMKEVIPDR